MPPTSVEKEKAENEDFNTITGFHFSAVLRFIELMCACQLPVGVAGGGAEVLDTWQAIVDDNLSHTEESIRVSIETSLATFTVRLSFGSQKCTSNTCI